MKPYINSKYALKGIFALASLAQKGGEVVHFSGKARKMNIPTSRERSERENQQFRFYVWFQNYFKRFLMTRSVNMFILDISEVTSNYK
ncbi:MAG: hypothetical protein U5L45_00605 [Saprospiraceae bacterium]|nr:hypothetical protein [Saprospiraceae bacterium]